MKELEKANLMKSKISTIPNDIINSLPKEMQENKYCYVYLGDRETGTIVESSAEIHGDFMNLVCGLGLNPIIRAIMVTSLKCIHIQEDKNKNSNQKRTEIVNLVNEMDSVIKKYQK